MNFAIDGNALSWQKFVEVLINYRDRAEIGGVYAYVIQERSLMWETERLIRAFDLADSVTLSTDASDVTEIAIA